MPYNLLPKKWPEDHRRTLFDRASTSIRPSKMHFFNYPKLQLNFRFHFKSRWSALVDLSAQLQLHFRRIILKISPHCPSPDLPPPLYKVDIYGKTTAFYIYFVCVSLSCSLRSPIGPNSLVICFGCRSHLTTFITKNNRQSTQKDGDNCQ